MVLTARDLIQWQNAHERPRIDRILVVSRECDQAITIDIDNDKAHPEQHALSELESSVQGGDAIKLSRDPYSEFRQKEEDLAQQYAGKWPKHRNRRDRRWSIIEPIVTALQDRIFDSSVLGPLVDRAFQSTGVSKTHIYEYLRYYWQRGMCRNALLRDYRRCGHGRTAATTYTKKLGRPSAAYKINGTCSGILITKKDEENFRRGTSLYYAKRDGCSLVQTYNKILQRYYNAGYEERPGGIRVPVLKLPDECPTFRQYQYWLDTHVDLTHIIRTRKGKRRFNLGYRAVPGRHRASIGQVGPGGRFQIDACFPNVYLVDDLERNVIGQPILYFVTDYWCEAIVGLSVGLEGPSWAGAMLALENMVRNKVEYCSSLGITIEHWEWPCEHFPRRIIADRGEMLSIASDNLAANFGITVSNTPAYRPDWKGLIEREFGLLKTYCLSWVPGHTNGWDDEPGDRDRRLDACMSLREFERYVVDFVIEYNTTHRVTDEIFTADMIRDGVEPYPNELWQWGLEHLSGSLHPPEDMTVVQRNLLPSDELSVTRDGLLFGGLHYKCDRADREHWVELARIPNKKKPSHKPILYDPRTPKCIFLNIDRSEKPERCELEDRDARFANCTWADVRHYLALRKVEDQDRVERARPDHAKHEATREAIVAEGKQKTRQAQQARGPESRAERLSGIRENRKAELLRDHQQREWLPGTQEQQERSEEESTQDLASLEAGEEAAAEAEYEDEIFELLSEVHSAAITQTTCDLDVAESVTPSTVSHKSLAD